MSMFKSCSFVLTLTLVLASTAAFALPEGYQMETVAEYPSGSLGEVRDIAFDPDGLIYLTHRGDSNLNFVNGSITRIDSIGVETRWIDNINDLRSMIWTGGTTFGDNFYIIESGTREVHKLDCNGNMSSIAYIYQHPGSIDVDRNGSLGGDIFVASRGTDSIQRIKPDGSVSIFSSWPGVVSGGVQDIAVSPTSKYSGNIFVTYDETYATQNDGLYQIDADGNATRFAPSINNARFLEFDTSGLMFGNDLFVIGTQPGFEGMHLWRIDEFGNAEDFMRVSWGVMDHLAFGPDGAMYLSKYKGDTTEILRVSLVSTPVCIDIKPNSCVNPLNVKSKGVLSVAILGTEEFDVFAIDVATISLQGVSPIRSGFADVSSPEIEQDCQRGPDGFMDLTLKFDKQEIIATLGDLTDVTNKTEMLLALTCKLMDGNAEFEGTDFVSILNPTPPNGPKEPVEPKGPKGPKKK